MRDTLYMNIRERLKELRADKRVLQSQIAKELKIPEATYSNWEQGRSEPDIANLIKLAFYFDVSIDYLVGKEN